MPNTQDLWLNSTQITTHLYLIKAFAFERQRHPAIMMSDYNDMLK